jgi:hypothetical protein
VSISEVYIILGRWDHTETAKISRRIHSLAYSCRTVPADMETRLVPISRTFLVSFTDSEGIRHAVEVAANSLYEAAALAISEFRRCGFTADAPSPATRLTVSVKPPATTHEVSVLKVEAWLQSGGKSPNEQALKVRLRELLGT